MIAVRPEDRVDLRFVWPNEDDQITVWRLKRVTAGLFTFFAQHNNSESSGMSKGDSRQRSSPRSHFAAADAKLVYVDDGLSSLSDQKKVDEFQQTSC